MTEGYKKKDIQRKRQKVDNGISLSSNNLASADDNHRIELGPIEKLTMATTGDLIVSVTPQIGDKNSNTAIVANNTTATTTLSNMAAAIEIAWTSGEGKVLILAK